MVSMLGVMMLISLSSVKIATIEIIIYSCRRIVFTIS